MAEPAQAEKWIATTCGYCSVGCGMLVGVRNGRAVASRGDPNHPVNQGRLCPKGLSEHKILEAPGRLTDPLVRSDRVAPFSTTSMDDALAGMANRIQDLVGSFGPRSFAVLSTGQLVTEEFYALGKLVRAGFKLAHYDGNTTLCMASAVSGYKASFGSDGPPGAYEDIEIADLVLAIGANLADNHPLLVPRLLRRRGRFVVVDPRVTKTAALADRHLAIAPRSDLHLLNAMMKVLIEEDLADLEFAATHADGLSELLVFLKGLDLQEACSACGLSVGEVEELAREFAAAESATVLWTMGVNHSTQGTLTVNAIINLCLLTGNIGRPGTGPMSVTGQCNAMGSREAAGTRSLPGYRSFASDSDRAELASLWGIPATDLPVEAGGAYPDIIEAVLRGEVRGLWVIGTNPTVSYPNRRRLEEALRRLDYLVVQDGFANPTAEFADLVLPAAIWGEKEGTFTNSERRVSRVAKISDPPGQARSDFDIFLGLARAAGLADRIFANWQSPADAYREWQLVSAGRLCDYSGLSWSAIEAHRGIQWPAPEPSTNHPVTRRLYGDLVFPTRSGRAQLIVTRPEPVPEAPDEIFPFWLNTGRTVEHWHTRTKTARVEVLDNLAPAAWIEMNPADVERLGLRPGGMVRVRSRRGEISAIAVKPTETMRPGEVYIPFHYDEACVNRVTLDEFDPTSREPNYKQAAVRIEPRPEDWSPAR